MEEAEDFAWQPTRDPFAFVRSFSDQPPEACRGLHALPFEKPYITNERASELPFNELSPETDANELKNSDVFSPFVTGSLPRRRK